jgi:hypothetical protein
MPAPPDKKSGPVASRPATSRPRRRRLDASTVQGCTDACRPVEVWFGGTLYSRRVSHWHGPVPWEHVDVVTLGLVPHPRETCGACQAAGS